MSLYPAWHNPIVRAQKWWLVDCHGHHVGRLASQITKLLTGKYKPSWNPSVDCGDYVVLINAKHVVFTGKKWTQKYYKWHTGWPGGLRQRQARIMLEKSPETIMRKAIVRMMKSTTLRSRYESRLLIYPEEQHPHEELIHEVYKPFRTKPATTIPRFDHTKTFDHSLRIVEDHENNQLKLSARIFSPNLSRKGIAAIKRTGFYGKGHTQAPTKSMYPGSFMLGPALSNEEWKLARKYAAMDKVPENWPKVDPALDETIKKYTAKYNTRLDVIEKNPLPKPQLANPLLTKEESLKLKVTPKTGKK